MRNALAVVSVACAALAVPNGGARAEPASFGAGVSLADPLGATAKLRLGRHAAVQAVVGVRLLEREGEYAFPGPLAAVDLVGQLPAVESRARGFRFSSHAGVGVGVGWVRAGCWYDAVAEFCVDDTEPALFLRAPIGIDLLFGRFELSIEAIPALRATPETHATFLGGITARYYVR